MIPVCRLESTQRRTKRLTKETTGTPESLARQQSTKTNENKSMAIAHINHSMAEKELKNISFQNNANLKHLRMNLTNDRDNLYDENYKTPEPEHEIQDMQIWRNYCFWAGMINITKTSILPKVICRCSVIPGKP